jgi:adenosylmethionine---8-amino-7-oxononanoate aminotransferase
VTLCTSDIFDAHRSTDRARMFFHSSSYTANPIACAAAAANLEIWRDEPVLQRITALANSQRAALTPLASDSRFRDVRQLGTLAAFDLNTGESGGGSGYLADVVLPLRAACLKRGVLVRPLGSTLYVMPPYCTTGADLTHVYAVISDAVDEVSA